MRAVRNGTRHDNRFISIILFPHSSEAVIVTEIRSSMNRTALDKPILDRPVLTYHWSGIESLDALHDLGFALLPAVLLSVYTSVTELLHHLHGGKNKQKHRSDEILSSSSSRRRNWELIRSHLRDEDERRCTWLSSILISSILLLACSTSSVSSSSILFCSSRDCL